MLLESKPQTVFVLDDDFEICKAIRWLLESVQINVETFQSHNLLLQRIRNESDGCILLDVRMPIMSGLDLLDQFRTTQMPLPVIVISGHGDVPMAVRAMKAGAVDFILKPFNDQKLLDTIQSCLGNKQKSHIPNYSDQKRKLLSGREIEILDLVLDGKLNKEVALILNISISTVEVHRSRIMKKMGVRNLAQLIKVLQ